MSNNPQPQVPMKMFKSVAEFCDVVSVMSYCSDDNSCLLANEFSANEFWLPCTKVDSSSSWHGNLMRCTNDLFGVDLNASRVLKLYKVWVPNRSGPFIFHCIYEVRVNQDLKKKSKNLYGKYRGKTRWFTEAELSRLTGLETVKSCEVLEFLSSIRGAAKTGPEGADITAPTEFVTNGIVTEIYENKVIVPAGSSVFAQLLDAAGYNKEVQTLIYKQYLLLCYPALYMSPLAFGTFATDLGWSKEDTTFLFRAADLNNRNGLSFLEFAYIFAATEPNTSHGGAPAELRCRYMFRFYDRDKDNILNYNEFKTLITAVRKSKKLALDMVSVSKDAEECYKGMGMQPDSSISIAEFLHAVGDLKLRGTSGIFRSNLSLIQRVKVLAQDAKPKSAHAGAGAAAHPTISAPSVVPPKPHSQADNKSVKSNPATSVGPPATVGIKGKMAGGGGGQAKNFEIALHTIQLQKSGTMINVDQIFSIENAITPSSMQSPTIRMINRKVSEDVFNQRSLSNEILKGLRYLAQMNSKATTSTKAQAKKQAQPKEYTWGQLDALQFARNIINLAHLAREVFKDEPRLMEISSPCYVMGDFHGNFHDLLYFEKVLWNLGPGLSPCTLLFLGDYVDRGDYSIEVASYLLSYKIQAPTKMRLLRGNHEIRDIQKMFTFYSECCGKFGEVVGKDVWNAVNSAFDSMPLTAVIDNKIFCCHGGIPPPWLCPVVAAINQIPNTLSQPDDQSSLAWDIMWNDPIRPKQMSEQVAMELMANEGFAMNTRRGTAHVWNAEALERFLTVNNFTHVIRAHEVAQAGFNLQQKGKLFTVFSSSKYCGSGNDAACIFVDQGKLRIMKLDTN